MIAWRKISRGDAATQRHGNRKHGGKIAVVGVSRRYD
jgi:hypothetical protein